MRKETKFTVKGFLVWSICALFFMYEFLLRTIIGTFQHPIMYDFNLTSVQFSFLSTTVYLIIFSILQVPVGLFVDNYGLKKTLLLGTGICVLSLIGFAYSYNYMYAVFFRFLTGVGSSIGFICLVVAVFEWMPPSKTAFWIGLSLFIGTMGPMVAAGPVEAYTESANINWRQFFLSLSAIGCCIMILITFFVCNNRGHIGAYQILNKPEKAIKRFAQIFKRLTPWMIAVYTALVYFAIEYLSENEGRMLIVLKGHSTLFASSLISLAWLSYAIACPVMGLVSDKIQRRKPLMLIAAIVCVAGLMGIIVSQNRLVLILSFILLGIGGGGQSVGFAIAAEYFQQKYVGISISFTNSMMSACAAVNAPLLAFVIDASRGNNIASLCDYDVAFYGMLALVSCGVFLSLLIIKETFCKSKMELTPLKPL